ncbi:hypothetical protein H072_6921 [Dactylellina haptotyla CBS 200.50]|uniref:F-box domain-containing protein n=1 Tax=Dactylellina haptotyla (strain CBS 200.50) TaxID=1284197 RepID=S8BVE0_DACHA|nr:hypothetical protein H072_6921 [Dactylellina haptotyla CBS 200.50]
MAPSRKRKTAARSVANPSKKRRSVRGPQVGDVASPFTTMPAELQLRVLRFCDPKTLAAVSITSNYFRELALRVLWEIQPVDTFLKNFSQLDKYEDLRLAVRHLAVRNNSTPSRSRMSGVTKRLVDRFPKNYFPGLTELTVEFHGATYEHFADIMNSISTHKPRNLKRLNIKVARRWTKLGDVWDTKHKEVKYPTDMKSIRVECSYGGTPFAFDPILALDASRNTLTTADIRLSLWYDHFSLQPCPKVKSLDVYHEVFDGAIAEKATKKFPNVEHLVLRAPQFGAIWHRENPDIVMEKYVAWNGFSALKSAELMYIESDRFGFGRVKCRDIVMKSFVSLIGKWIAGGKLKDLEKVRCYYQNDMYWRGGRGTEPVHSFDLLITKSGELRSVTVGNITRFPEEDPDDIDSDSATPKESRIRVILE